MTTTDKGYKGLPMEGPIAKWYAKTTYTDLNRHHVLAEQLAADQLHAGSRVLEVAPGPGYFCIELAKLGDYAITGLDISRSFVEIARANAADAGEKVDFRLGNASDMPFEDNAFDFIVCQAAFKNFSQPVQAIAEMHRVLSPGGTALIIDMRHDATEKDINREVSHMGVGPINRAFIKWTFHSLLKRAYSTKEMESFVRQTPFRTCQIRESGIGFQVWMNKTR